MKHTDEACCAPACCDDLVETTASRTDERTGIKALVQQKYAGIASQDNEASCCSPNCCGSAEADMIGDAYSGVAGYVAEADLKLGCGVPTELAEMQPGEVVLDLGSGAGLDAFVARQAVGTAGRVVGIDMTPEMIAKARANAQKLGFKNVRFVLGDIEALPLGDALFDLVLSNCVLNLVPDKAAAFAEMYRVLKPGGRFCVSDIVASRPLPAALRDSVALYTGCVAGAMERAAYLALLRATGFAEVEVAAEQSIPMPGTAGLLNAPRLQSVTVRGWKR